MTYHASTWPLFVPPYTDELLRFLDRDHGTTPLSTDSEFAQALSAAGHDLPEASTYSRQALESHRVRRYEAQTGHPF